MEESSNNWLVWIFFSNTYDTELSQGHVICFLSNIKVFNKASNKQALTFISDSSRSLKLCHWVVLHINKGLWLIVLNSITSHKIPLKVKIFHILFNFMCNLIKAFRWKTMCTLWKTMCILNFHMMHSIGKEMCMNRRKWKDLLPVVQH